MMGRDKKEEDRVHSLCESHRGRQRCLVMDHSLIPETVYNHKCKFMRPTNGDPFKCCYFVIIQSYYSTIYTGIDYTRSILPPPH